MVQESAKPELTDLHLAILERLRARGFQFIALPLYERKIGVRKRNCAALLDPVPEGLRVFGAPAYLVAENLSVVIHSGEERFFVWKQNKVPATAERLEELERFGRELSGILASA
jgi:hypothetical protein